MNFGEKKTASKKKMSRPWLAKRVALVFSVGMLLGTTAASGAFFAPPSRTAPRSLRGFPRKRFLPGLVAKEALGINAAARVDSRRWDGNEAGWGEHSWAEDSDVARTDAEAIARWEKKLTKREALLRAKGLAGADRAAREAELTRVALAEAERRRAAKEAKAVEKELEGMRKALDEEERRDATDEWEVVSVKEAERVNERLVKAVESQENIYFPLVDPADTETVFRRDKLQAQKKAKDFEREQRQAVDKAVSTTREALREIEDMREELARAEEVKAAREAMEIDWQIQELEKRLEKARAALFEAGVIDADFAYGGAGSARVTINKDTVEFTAGLLGASASIALLGGLTNPALTAAVAAATNYMSKTDGEAGEVVRDLTTRGLESYNHIVKLGVKYAVLQRAKTSLEKALEVAVEPDTIRDVEVALTRTNEQIRDLDDEFNLVINGSAILRTAGTLVETAMGAARKVAKINNKYRPLEMITLTVMEAAEALNAVTNAEEDFFSPEVVKKEMVDVKEAIADLREATAREEEQASVAAQVDKTTPAPLVPKRTLPSAKKATVGAEALNLSEEFSFIAPTSKLGVEFSKQKYIDSATAASAASPSLPKPIAPIAAEPESLPETPALPEVAAATPAVSKSLPSSSSKPVMSYLDAISETCTAVQPDPECGSAITSYLDSLNSIGVGSAARPSGKGLTTPLDMASPGAGGGSTATAAMESSVSAVASYLDSLGGWGGAAPPVAAPPAPVVLPAETSGAGATSSSQFASTYSTKIMEGSPASCLDAVTSMARSEDRPTEVSNKAVASYLDTLSSGGATSGLDSSPTTIGASSPIIGKGVPSYLDSLSSGDVRSPPTREANPKAPSAPPPPDPAEEPRPSTKIASVVAASAAAADPSLDASGSSSNRNEHSATSGARVSGSGAVSSYLDTL